MDRSTRFYEKLGFTVMGEWPGYRILEDAKGASLHLAQADSGFLDPNFNPCGIYLYTEDVDALAAKFPGEILGPSKHPEEKEWGMYEFALSDPDEALVRIGWPTRLRNPAN